VSFEDRVRVLPQANNSKPPELSSMGKESLRIQVVILGVDGQPKPCVLLNDFFII